MYREYRPPRASFVEQCHLNLVLFSVCYWLDSQDQYPGNTTTSIQRLVVKDKKLLKRLYKG